MSKLATLEQLQSWLDRSPFHALLGVEAVAADADAAEVVLRVPFRQALQRSDTAAELHGGVTAALIDIAGDYALALVLGEPMPTINLRIDYLRMVRDSAITATARVIKSGRSIGFVDITVTDDEGRLVAIGRGNYIMVAG